MPDTSEFTERALAAVGERVTDGRYGEVTQNYHPQLNPIEIRLSPAPEVTVLEWAKLNQVVYAAVLKAVKDSGLESRVR
jgi:hypothetical protein